MMPPLQGDDDGGIVGGAFGEALHKFHGRTKAQDRDCEGTVARQHPTAYYSTFRCGE